MIKVHIKADSRYPIDRDGVRKLVRDFLDEMGVDEETQIGVVVIGDRKMKMLNKEYLKVDGTTDVLSFSQTEMKDHSASGISEFIEPVGEGFVSWGCGGELAPGDKAGSGAADYGG